MERIALIDVLTRQPNEELLEFLTSTKIPKGDRKLVMEVTENLISLFVSPQTDIDRLNMIINDSETLEDLYFNLPSMDKPKANLEKEISYMRVKEKGVSGIFKCRKCNSDNTTARSEQKRANDEGAYTLVTCNDCGAKYWIRN